MKRKSFLIYSFCCMNYNFVIHVDQCYFASSFEFRVLKFEFRVLTLGQRTEFYVEPRVVKLPPVVTQLYDVIETQFRCIPTFSGVNLLMVPSVPAPLLLLSFILKLTIVTLYSIYLLHKRFVFNLSLTLLLVLSPKLLNLITILLFLNLTTGSR